jgi:hypothetical protein
MEKMFSIFLIKWPFSIKKTNLLILANIQSKGFLNSRPINACDLKWLFYMPRYEERYPLIQMETEIYIL